MNIILWWNNSRGVFVELSQDSLPKCVLPFTGRVDAHRCLQAMIPALEVFNDNSNRISRAADLIEAN
ncbi:MAG: hypothetical protein PVF14_06510, partial [Desulfobacterales bacterium]